MCSGWHPAAIEGVCLRPSFGSARTQIAYVVFQTRVFF
jgi:hypothetical protein